MLDTPEKAVRRANELRLEQERRRRRKAESRSLIHAIRRIWPWFIVEEVHLLLAGHIEGLVFGFLDRLMSLMAPRTGKSMVGSVIAPSFYIGNHPSRKVMVTSHQKELALEFGRDSKEIIQDEDYQLIFPGVELRADAKAAGRWHTNKRGVYTAAGVTGGIAGKGWNFGSADDLLNEQTAYSDTINQRVINWWGPGFYSRRQPDISALLLTMTRWRKNDIAGHLIQLGKTDPKADQYTVLKIPAIVDEATAEMLNQYSGDPLLSPLPNGNRVRFKPGDSFAPRRWPLKELNKQRANMSSKAFESLYLQNPTEEEGAIIKRVWWRKWPEKRPPQAFLVVQVYDTAFEEEDMGITKAGKKKHEPDFTARTTWALFEHTDVNGIVRPSMCVIERLNRRMGFPELRHEAWDSYKTYRDTQGIGEDRMLVLVEKKASGHSLIQELKRKGVPVREITIDKGASKTARAHGASMVFEQGCVWYMDRPWAQEVINQTVEFPFGEFNDLGDTAVHAALFLRRKMWIRTADEPPEEEDESLYSPHAGGQSITLAD